MPDSHELNNPTDTITRLAAPIYRVTINRLAIATRIADNQDYDPSLPWQLTLEDWQTAAQKLQTFLNGTTTINDDNTLVMQRGLLQALAPYDRPDLTADDLQKWRDLDFHLEDRVKENQEPTSTTPAWQQAHLLPLVEFYAGLKRIDQRVAKLYDGKRYERLMKICLWIGGGLLVMAVLTAVAKGLKDFDWTKIPLEGSMGVLCGFALGILLDYRRRIKTRNLIEDWGDKFGCDLRGMRWRQLPIFTQKIEQELNRLGGGQWVSMTPEKREEQLANLAESLNYQRI